jgi:hypothetical protein
MWVAAGYNSIGIVSAGGAGMALAQWMEEGEAPFDLWDVDIRRAQPFQRNRTLSARAGLGDAGACSTPTISPIARRRRRGGCAARRCTSI